MSRSRPTRDELRRHHTVEWLQERASAETMLCPECHAKPGITCTNLHTGRPLQGQPAHLARILAYLAAPVAVAS